MGLSRAIAVVVLVAACRGGAAVHPVVSPDDTDATGHSDVPADSDLVDTDRPGGSDDWSRGENVMIILADDLGVDVVHSYGLHPDAPPTPNIDALAARGVRFTHAYTFPTCSPTRAAILTGRTARRTGVGRTVETTNEEAVLPLSEVLLPEALAPAGYASSAVGKWHLGALTEPDGARNPLDQGFGWSAGPFANLTRVEVDGLMVPATYWLWNKDDNGTMRVDRDYVLSDEVDDAIARAQAMPEPWFMWVALTSPHSPFHAPPSDLLSAPVSAHSHVPVLYRAMVEAMDTEIGRLLASIPADVLARTTVIFLGDNGTPTEATLAPFDAAGAKDSLHEGGTRVPLVIAGPAVAAPGAVSDGLVQALDLFPTVLELAGVAPGTGPMDGVRIDGTSLLPMLRGTTDHLHDDVVTEQFAPNGPGPYTSDERAVRDDRWRLIEDSTGARTLYDVRAAGDIRDGHDLIAAGPLDPDAQAALTRLAARLDAWATDVGATPR